MLPTPRLRGLTIYLGRIRRANTTYVSCTRSLPPVYLPHHCRVYAMYFVSTLVIFRLHSYRSRFTLAPPLFLDKQLTNGHRMHCLDFLFLLLAQVIFSRRQDGSHVCRASPENRKPASPHRNNNNRCHIRVRGLFPAPLRGKRLPSH